MIQIPPYDSPSRGNGEAILDLYLSMVADVVPFYPEDVLNGHPRKTDAPTAAFRKRTKNYVEKLKECKIIDNSSRKEDKRKNDALLAKYLISKYSNNLYNRLYKKDNSKEEYSDGHVNPGQLRNLLTVRINGGKLADFDYKDGEGQFSNDLLEYVFRYEKFSMHTDLYKLIGMLGVEVCPYCNRQFITTLIPPEDTSDEKKKGSKTRPQLDHFKAKTKYPYLALSITNLIPCCGVCNHMKGDVDIDTLYPYSEGLGDTYKFKTTIPGQEQLITQVLTGAHIAPEHFDITLDSAGKEVDEGFCNRVEQSKSVFALEGLYQSHKGYVSDMYFHRYITTEEMIDSIMDQFKGLFKSRDEVRQALMLVDTSADALGKRPLAKLTKDIKEEIEEYYSRIRPSDK
jgi:hypothetical protein